MKFKVLIHLKLIIISSLIFTASNLAQSPDVLWTRTFGGTSYDYCYSAQQTSDGGYILTGSTTTTGTNQDIWLIRTDSIGNALWAKTYGGIYLDQGISVVQTFDGGFIITGLTGNPAANGLPDIFLLKTNGNGETIWSKTFGDTNSADHSYSVQQLSDGGYILAGSTTDTTNNTNNIIVIRTDNLGNTLWSNTYGGQNNEDAFCIREVTPFGFIISGYTDSDGAGDNDVWIIRIDDSGIILWARTFGEVGIPDYSYSVEQTTDEGFVVVGETYPPGSGNLNAWLIRLNNAGDTLWTKTYGGTSNDWGTSVKQTSDSGFIITGVATVQGNGYDVLIVKTDSAGDTLWTKIIGGSNRDYGNSICQTTDGGYMVAGITKSFGSGLEDFYLIKLDTDIPTSVQTLYELNNPDEYQLFQNYPNPFNPSTKISWQSPVGSHQSLKIYDVLGTEVATLVDEYKPAGSYEVQFDAINLSSGVYFYQLKSGEFIETKKLILLR